ncbi:MAG TPA: hypothetical protein VFS92_03185, partial [Planctomycetota bacterium]|nr:hypothetical protein [Planctomycetota bacterium]
SRAEVAVARLRAWPDACLVTLAALLAACASPRPDAEIDREGPSLVAVRVGGEPTRMVASRDGRTLLVATAGPHGVSVIDPRRPGTPRRIPVPVRERDEAGEETFGYVADIAIAEDGTVAWACTTEGQVFSLDLARGAIRDSLELPGHATVAIVVDDARGRVIVGSEEGAILALEPAGPRELLRPGQPVRRMKRTGDLLDVAAGPTAFGGSGIPGGEREITPDRLLTLDLASDRLAAQAPPTTSRPVDFARGPDGLLVATDGDDERLLEFDGRWSPRGERRMGVFCSWDLAFRGDRLLVSSMNEGRVLEYGVSEGRLSSEPVAEYALPEKGGRLVVLDGDWFAVAPAPGDSVLLVHRSWARPFSGFEEP